MLTSGQSTTPLTPDTIAAVATPPGQGGIGIVRISGPLAAGIGASITGAALSRRRPESPAVRPRWRTARRGHRALLPGAGLLYRRGCSRTPGTRRSHGPADGAGSGSCPGCQAGAARGVHRAGVRQRQAGPGPGGSGRRPDRQCIRGSGPGRLAVAFRGVLDGRGRTGCRCHSTARLCGSRHRLSRRRSGVPGERPGRRAHRFACCRGPAVARAGGDKAC